MGTYLDEILERKRADLVLSKDAVPLTELQARSKEMPPAADFEGALRAPGLQIIGEIKKASPSRGLMAPNIDPVATAYAYATAGVAAISVLTEGPHFHGRLDYLKTIKMAFTGDGPPLLRKDFIVDPYQIWESKVNRADALLLIVAALTDELLSELLGLSGELGLQVLVEVHDEVELRRAVDAGSRIIGINNRNLRTFETSLETTTQLRPRIPEGRVVVSESGISEERDVQKLRSAGVDALLIGEALVTSGDPVSKLRELLGQ